MVGAAPVAQPFDSQPCMLGEGPLWHPALGALFWFDILAGTLFMRSAETRRRWTFDQMVSAAGWVDEDTLLVAGERALMRFSIASGQRQDLMPLEADSPQTRSNDGRADPWGGFWIGTMGKQAQQGAGAIYRFNGGVLRRLFSGITIPNAIAFAPDRGFATFADTVTGRVMRVALDPADGSPMGEPEVFLDLSRQGLNPDGAVFDAQGRFWLAQWGASRVACYGQDGAFLSEVKVPTPHASCPAFGGDDLQTLFVTTAQQGLAASDAAFGQAGQTFSARVAARGQREHQVVL